MIEIAELGRQDFLVTTALFATGDIALPTLQNLIEIGQAPAVLVTQPDKPIGRSQSTCSAPAIKLLALRHGIPVWQPEKINHVADKLSALSPDYIIVFAYGQMIGRAVRETAKLAILNLHASLLPKYRGASCIQAAIASGDAETGITVIHVTAKLDAGDIVCAKRIRIQPNETAGELHDRLATLAPKALLEALQLLKNNPDHRTKQDEEVTSYAPKLDREDGRLDLQQAAPILERMIRAYHPWPGTFTTVSPHGKQKRLKIFPDTSVEPIKLPPGTLKAHEQKLLLGTGKDSLSLTKVQLEGAKVTSGIQFSHQLPREDPEI